jgi:hypothetical protein
MLEKEIERKCIRLAKVSHNVANVKLEGTVGWPDRLFLYAGRVMFIEFKAPGKLPRPAQVNIHKQLRAIGFTVHIVDSVAEFEILIGNWLEEVKCLSLL